MLEPGRVWKLEDRIFFFSVSKTSYKSNNKEMKKKKVVLPSTSGFVRKHTNRMSGNSILKCMIGKQSATALSSFSWIEKIAVFDFAVC